MRKKILKKGFTFVEILVSIAILGILTSIIFSMFHNTARALVVFKNSNILINENVKIKEYFIKEGNTYAFYDYETIINGSTTNFDIENEFRKNILVLLNNYFNETYGINFENNISFNRDLSLSYDNDGSVLSVNSYNKNYSTPEQLMIEDLFNIKVFNNDIESDNFKEKNKILISVNKEKLNVDVFFIYNSKLHILNTKLMNNLDLINIIDVNHYNGIINDNINITSFVGYTGNSCDLNNKFNKDNNQCIFHDFYINKEYGGTIYLHMMKLIKTKERINIKGSSQHKTIINL